MSKKIFYPFIILCLTAFFVSCEDDNDNEENEAEAWRAKNESFFNELADRSDLRSIIAESGKGKIYYKVIKQGIPSEDKPVYTSTISVHYYGATLDGFDAEADTIVKSKCFDTSYSDKNLLFPTEEHPASDPQYNPYSKEVSSFIEGWWIALQEMVPGDKWQLYIPQELGYGTSGSGDDIPGYSTLIFEVELISFTK